MSQIYFIADTHFGHKNCAKWRGFSSIEEHDEHIIESWNKVIRKKDTVYILGDVTTNKATNYPILDRLRGFKKVVMGNHDEGNHARKLLEHVNSVAGMVKYKHCVLTHCPIHPSQLERFKFNLHGHLHGETLNDPRYFCVSCEAIDYTPISWEQIMEIRKVTDQ